MLLNTCLIMMLLYLLYQDWRYRAVYWALFPLLLCLFVSYTLRASTLTGLLENSLYNLAFIASQLIFLSLYFSIKYKRWVNITRQHLGLGDVLFLICAAFCFSPCNYFAFYIISLLGSALLALFMLARNRGKGWTVPLAGLQALFLALTLLADWNIEKFSINSDEWLLTNLYQ